MATRCEVKLVLLYFVMAAQALYTFLKLLEIFNKNKGLDWKFFLNRHSKISPNHDDRKASGLLLCHYHLIFKLFLLQLLGHLC